MDSKLRRLSPSKLNILRDCPRCFWLQEKGGIKRPPSIFPTLPNGVDRILKEYFDSMRNVEGWASRSLGIDGELYSNQADIKKWRHWRSGLSCEFPELGIELIGALDDSIVTLGSYSPLDYKSRGYPPKTSGAEYYQSQLDCYSLMLSRNGFPTTGKGYILYFWTEKAESLKDFTFSKQLFEIPCSKDNAIKLLEKAKNILALSEPPEASEKCGYCNYVKEVMYRDGRLYNKG